MRTCKAIKKQQLETRYQLQLEDQINDLQCQLAKARSEKETQDLILKKLSGKVNQLSKHNISDIQQQINDIISELSDTINEKDEIYAIINNTVDNLNDELQNIVQLIKEQQKIDSQLIQTFQKRIELSQKVKTASKKEQTKSQSFNQYMRILTDRINDKDRELNGLLNEVPEQKESCDYRQHLQKYEEQFQLHKHNKQINDEDGKIDLVQLVQTELGRISSPHNSDQVSNDGLRLSPVHSDNSNTPREEQKPILDKLLGKVAEGLELMQQRQ